MTKRIFFNHGQSFGIGSYKEKLQRSVQGTSVNFSLYDKQRNPRWSKWIKGKPNVFFELKHHFCNRNKKEFKNLFDKLFEEFT